MGLEWSKFSGLFPQSRLILGTGWAREDFKSEFFGRGLALGPFALTTDSAFVTELAEVLIPEFKSGAIRLSLHAERLWIEDVLGSESGKKQFPLLSRWATHPDGLVRIQNTLRDFQVSVATPADIIVLSERLDEIGGRTDLKVEFENFVRVWQVFLASQNLFDDARVLRVLIERFDENPLESSSTLTEAFNRPHWRLPMVRLSHDQTIPPLWKLFWDRCSMFFSLSAPLTFLSDDDVLSLDPPSETPVPWVSAPTWDDLVFHLADWVEQALRENKSVAVVIPDRPQFRSLLIQKFQRKNIPWFDPRDPTALRFDESFKRLFILPRAVASGLTFEALRSVAVAYGFQEDWIRLGQKNHRTGIESVLRVAPEFGRFLEPYFERFRGVRQFSQARQAWLDHVTDFYPELQVFFERLWSEFEQDEKVALRDQRKAPLLWWLNELEKRARSESPPSEPFRRLGGVGLFRLDQGVSPRVWSQHPTQIHLIGLTRADLEVREKSTLWPGSGYEDRLAEFGYPSRFDRESQFKASLSRWMKLPGVTLWECEGELDSGDGDSAFQACAHGAGLSLATLKPLGIHPDFDFAYQGASLRNLRIETGLSGLLRTFSFRFLAEYSQCPFSAWYSHLNRTQEEPELSGEPQPLHVGVLVHRVLEILYKEGGSLSLNDSDVWDRILRQALSSVDLQALLGSERTHTLLSDQVKIRIMAFLAEETSYRERSQSVPIYFELPVQAEWAGLTFRGRLDRVDRHHEGLVIWDYKTSESGFDAGKKELEKGILSQASLYALALSQNLPAEGPVLASGYIFYKHSERKVLRSKGYFPQRLTQKKSSPFPLVEARSNNDSVFDAESDEIWKSVSERLNVTLGRLKSGDFSANPADPKKCDDCSARFSCGQSRSA